MAKRSTCPAVKDRPDPDRLAMRFERFKAVLRQDCATRVVRAAKADNAKAERVALYGNLSPPVTAGGSFLVQAVF